MSQKDAFYAATFSVMMPGLGQLYTHRLVPGVGFFMIFATALAVPSFRYFLPVIAAIAATESYLALKAVPKEGESWRSGERAYWSQAKDAYRLPAFSFVGILGAMAWMFLLFPMLSPMGAQADINDRVDQLAQHVYAYRAKHGVKAYNLEEALKAKSDLLRDPWGNAYLLEYQESGFVIRSVGPDAKPQTGDDLRYSFP